MDIDLIAIFIFYKIAQGRQAKLSFSKEFKHVNVITYDGKDFIMLDFDPSGLLTRRIKATSANKLLKNLRILNDISAIVCVNITQRKKITWKPWWVRSCNEICRYASGIDVGFTFNPVHFYRKLLKYSHNRNYEILSHWRRSSGIPKLG